MPFNELQWQDTMFYGSHAYILFNSAYDRYLNFFNAVPSMMADGRIYNYIKETYVTNEPFFIQYSEQASMNKHHGYIFNGNNDVPPEGFPDISEYDK